MRFQRIINFFAWTFISIVGLVIGTVVLLMGVGFLGVHPHFGFFPESHFRLAPESRLPKWFAVDKDHKREDLQVEIYYYTPVFGKTNFIAYLIGPSPDLKKLEKKYGAAEWHPITKKKLDAKSDHYPSFHIVTVDGITELIEHRHKAPIFHVSDDPEMRRYLR
jgi:hypothetical protein